MRSKTYDEFAEEYDVWFLNNENVLLSEVKLVAYFLKDAGRVLSIGCGSGLFEMILKRDCNISITDGIEPSTSMAEIARKRGMNVTISSAEDGNFGTGEYDTLLFNGCPSYINDLQKSFDNAYKVLKKGGKIVVLDVPKEGAYALLYNLAKSLETWDHPLLKGVSPPTPYPIEFVKTANWRTTAEKVSYLIKSGFSDFQFAQTLTKHPLYTNYEVENPSVGFENGNYIAICGYK